MRWTLTRINFFILLILIVSCGKDLKFNSSSKETLNTTAESLSLSDSTDSTDTQMMNYFVAPISADVESNFTQSYLEKIQDVLRREVYFPGYPTWYGVHKLGLDPKAGTMAGVFWSNAAVTKIMEELGLDFEILMNEVNSIRDIDYTTSYDVYQNVLMASKDSVSNVQELDQFSAQRNANEGKLVLVAAIFDKKKLKGRLGVVIPETQKFSFVNGPIIATSSPLPGYYQYTGWKNLSASTKFFLIPKKVTVPLPLISSQANKLISTITNVIERVEFQPGYPSWQGLYVYNLPRVAGAEPGVTWCNKAAYTIVKEMNFDVGPLIQASGGIEWTDADTMAKNLEEASLDQKNGVRAIDELTAQKLANAGQVVVVASEKSSANLSGHIGVVAPKNGQYNPRLGPLIGQAGAFNGFVTVRKWRVDWEKSPKFYALQNVPK